MPLRSTTLGLMPRLTKKPTISSDSRSSLGRGLAGGACCLPRALPSAEPVPTGSREASRKHVQHYVCTLVQRSAPARNCVSVCSPSLLAIFQAHEALWHMHLIV